MRTLSVFSIVAIVVRAPWHLIVASIYIYLMINDAEHFSHILLPLTHIYIILFIYIYIYIVVVVCLFKLKEVFSLLVYGNCLDIWYRIRFMCYRYFLPLSGFFSFP